MSAKTLFEKIWTSHLVTPPTSETPGVLYIDLHLVHEVTSPQAFEILRARGLKVRRPELTFATMDHSIPSSPAGSDGKVPFIDASAAQQVKKLEENCREFGVPLFSIGDSRQGIVHVVGPELGLTQPGKTIVCGDSHTSTHGAFGALAFGIGTSEVAHVLATQCLLQQRAKTFNVRVDGRLKPGVTAKDMILAIIARIGTSGGTGSVIEYTGSAIRSLSMEERMTVCNMTIEAGARAGLIAPDDTTFEYLANREHSPKGAAWEKALSQWKTLPTDEGAVYDREIVLDGSVLDPMITYGTSPDMGLSIRDRIPASAGNPQMEKALRYMGFTSGETVIGKAVDVVFIGSCTNSRISDLRSAASIMRGRKVASGVRVLVVPGSQGVRKQAEAEGLDRVFKEAGAEWREPSCSMCIAMNGDELKPGQVAVSTSNRNFEGRQGKGGRTLLSSPLTAAATAVTGVVTDPRDLMR